ncbi:MAG: hypothetical protein ABI863_18585 [Ginsengibacter sp.]
MRYFFIFILLLTFGSGCKPKVLSGVALQNKLIETMSDYLHKTLKPGVQFTIKDIIYYPEQDLRLYVCEFHVNMRYNNKDTTGLVAATITNDFSKVSRTR